MAGLARAAPQHKSGEVSTPRPAGSGRPSGVPYPLSSPLSRHELPERGLAGSLPPFGLRAAARVIDFVIVLLPVNALARVLGESVDDRFEAPTWVLWIFPLTFVVYETVLVSRSGQTLGKLLCRMKVVEWTTGELPTAREAAIRAMVPGIFLMLYLLIPPLLLFVPVVYLSSIADTLARGVHDKAANTIVLLSPRPLPG